VYISTTAQSNVCTLQLGEGKCVCTAFFCVAVIFGVDKETFSELDLPRFAEGFLAQHSDAQKGRNLFHVWLILTIDIK
jgi:hypothetical protein